MSETNTVKTAMQLIFETYNGITSTDINYGNLTTSDVATWKIGRQLTEQKRSIEYLKELSRQCFIALFPTRDGKYGMSFFLHNRTPIATHDESEIIQDSIIKFDKTPISKVYNDIKVNYDYNPAENRFNKSMYVTKPDEESFPDVYTSTGIDTQIATFMNIQLFDWNPACYAVFSASVSWANYGDYVSYIGNEGIILFGEIVMIDSVNNAIGFTFVDTYNMRSNGLGPHTSGTFWHHTTNQPLWTSYAGGFGNDYGTAKSLWDKCHNSYLRTKNVNPLPKELSDCYWFPDNEKFTSGTGGSQNAVFQYMKYLVTYVTRQKYIAEYRIKMNSANITHELADCINFSDAKYTNNVNYLGWITKVKYYLDQKNRSVGIEAILEPTDMLWDGVIVETLGIAPNIIVESISVNADVVVEDL